MRKETNIFSSYTMLTRRLHQGGQGAFSTSSGITRGILQGGPWAFPLLESPKAFTLVELIVVVTILALLSTIGFVSYSSYLSGVRDTNRLSQLVAISDGLELYRTSKTLPIPDDNIEIRANGIVIGYQGYAGVNVLETIDYSKTGKDPKDKTYFSYYLTQDKKHYQLLTYLEEEENLEVKNSLFQKTYADTDYTNRYPKVSGKKLGILTQSGTNIPVQEVTELVSSGYLDIATTTDEYVARLTDDNNIEGDGTNLIGMLPQASCNRVKQMGGSIGDGEYKINPTGTGTIKVYCDMSTDGGGWTMLINATGAGTKFGNRSSFWITPSYDTIIPDGPKDIEFQSEAYGLVNTNNILLCYQDMDHCYNFDHNMNIPLLKFFTDDISFTKYSNNSAGYSDEGSVSDLTNFETTIGATISQNSCQRLGINYRGSPVQSALGAISDADGGCTSGYHDNSALGLGLNSCQDGSGCGTGPHVNNYSGQICSTSLGNGTIGPWFVFGR